MIIEYAPNVPPLMVWFLKSVNHMGSYQDTLIAGVHLFQRMLGKQRKAKLELNPVFPPGSDVALKEKNALDGWEKAGVLVKIGQNLLYKGYRMMVKFTKAEQKILQILGDGLRHHKTDIAQELNGEDSVAVHISNIRKRIRPLGHDIVCEYHQRKLYYRYVRLINIA